jgi:hypothetical protein
MWYLCQAKVETGATEGSHASHLPESGIGVTDAFFFVERNECP